MYPLAGLDIDAHGYPDDKIAVISCLSITCFFVTRKLVRGLEKARLSTGFRES